MAARFPQAKAVVMDPVEVPPIPNYPALKEPRISVCKKGAGHGQLNRPTCIEYSESSHLLYVADVGDLGRVCVFSKEGEYINSFGEEVLLWPTGVVISEENVYVSDCIHHSIFHFKIPEYLLVNRVGRKGSGENEFSTPAPGCVASNGEIFFADCGNNRVVVMDCELRFKQSIQHSTMTHPNEVKLLNEEVYVICLDDNPCLHVFSRSGSKLRSFITSGSGSDYQVEGGSCFCFDKQSNILIGDETAIIKVFSPAGTLLHTLGDTQEGR